MARAPQSRQHPWLSELVAGPPSRHCPQEPVVALPALGAAHQPAVCCARRRASQRRRTPRQRRGRAFASVALLPPVVETASAAAPLASKFPTRSVPSTPSPTDRGRWECRLDDVRTRTQRLLKQLENTSTRLVAPHSNSTLHRTPAAECFRVSDANSTRPRTSAVPEPWRWANPSAHSPHTSRHAKADRREGSPRHRYNQSSVTPPARRLCAQ